MIINTLFEINEILHPIINIQSLKSPPEFSSPKGPDNYNQMDSITKPEIPTIH